MARQHKRFMQRLGRLFVNLGNLFGSLYGAGNSGGVTYARQVVPISRRHIASHRKQKRNRG